MMTLELPDAFVDAMDTMENGLYGTLVALLIQIMGMRSVVLATTTKASIQFLLGE